MQKIKLFSQYDSETLFGKICRDIRDQIRQWPETNFLAAEIDTHKEAIRNRFGVKLPKVDFANGREIEMEKVFPRSMFQPGAKPDQNVRINVLVYKYTFEGEAYLLGCRPAAEVPEPSGEWLMDPAYRSLTLEYTAYAKSPRKVLTSHREYIPKLISAYQALRLEFEQFENELNNVIDAAMQERQEEIEAFNKILSLFKS
jgi:hypothetical protein